MNDGNAKDELAKELRRMLLEAARDSGGSAQSLADSIAAKAADQLRPDLERIAEQVRPGPIEQNAQLSDDQITALADQIATKRNGDSGAGGSRNRGDAGESASVWSTGLLVFSAAALGMSLVLTILASLMFWWSIDDRVEDTTGGTGGSGAAAAELSPLETAWDAAEARIAFGGELPRRIACGTQEEGDPCNEWAQVRQNLADAFTDNADYVQAIGAEVKRVTNCQIDPPEAPSDPQPLLNVMEQCLEAMNG